MFVCFVRTQLPAPCSHSCIPGSSYFWSGNLNLNLKVCGVWSVECGVSHIRWSPPICKDCELCEDKQTHRRKTSWLYKPAKFSTAGCSGLYQLVAGVGGDCWAWWLWGLRGPPSTNTGGRGGRCDTLLTTPTGPNFLWGWVSWLCFVI